MTVHKGKWSHAILQASPSCSHGRSDPGGLRRRRHSAGQLASIAFQPCGCICRREAQQHGAGGLGISQTGGFRGGIISGSLGLG